jgi:hypothetical protein
MLCSRHMTEMHSIMNKLLTSSSNWRVCSIARSSHGRTCWWAFRWVSSSLKASSHFGNISSCNGQLPLRFSKERLLKRSMTKVRYGQEDGTLNEYDTQLAYKYRHTVAQRPSSASSPVSTVKSKISHSSTAMFFPRSGASVASCSLGTFPVAFRVKSVKHWYSSSVSTF